METFTPDQMQTLQNLKKFMQPMKKEEQLLMLETVYELIEEFKAINAEESPS